MPPTRARGMGDFNLHGSGEIPSFRRLLALGGKDVNPVKRPSLRFALGIRSRANPCFNFLSSLKLLQIGDLGILGRRLGIFNL